MATSLTWNDCSKFLEADVSASVFNLDCCFAVDNESQFAVFHRRKWPYATIS